jgi:hypothetical protein
MTIQRKPAVTGSHPLSSLAAGAPAATAETATPETDPKADAAAASAETKESPATTTTRSAESAAGPADTDAYTSTDPYAGSVQLNVRSSGLMREHLRAAAAGMTMVTGERWSQDRIVRNAVASYLDQLAHEYNDGRPFHQR